MFVGIDGIFHTDNLCSINDVVVIRREFVVRVEPEVLVLIVGARRLPGDSVQSNFCE